MKSLLMLVVALALTAPVFSGCKTTQADGSSVYDPTKTENLKLALEPLVTSLVRRGLLAKPESRVYVEGMTSALEAMRDSKSFDPSVLDGGLNLALNDLPKDKEWAQYVIDVKNTLYAVYTIFWKQKSSVELSEEEWGYHLTDFFATTLRRALADSAVE